MGRPQGGPTVLLVVLGAGASYDSVPALPPPRSDDHPILTSLDAMPNRPPLAAELFATRQLFKEVLTAFPACHPVIPILRSCKPGGPSIEEVLERLQDEAREHPNRLKQLAAIRFYIQVMLAKCQKAWEDDAGGITNYKTLLDQISRWRTRYSGVCLVTFNYDTMLENALDVIGLRVTSIEDYIRDKFYKVIKVHGSIDWAHGVDAGMDISGRLSHLEAANWLIENTVPTQVHASYRRIPFGHFAVDATGRPRSPIVPALAIPFQNKRDFSCPDEHLTVLQQTIPAVTKVVIIGWRAADYHFLELLRALKRPAVAVVSGSRKWAEDTADRLTSRGIDGSYWLADGGFTEFVTAGDADQFLRS
jgi:hypothetical protein